MVAFIVVTRYLARNGKMVSFISHDNFRGGCEDSSRLGGKEYCYLLVITESRAWEST